MFYVDETSKTGLRWKVSPHPRIQPHEIAGTIARDGYYIVQYKKSQYKVHRVIWAICNAKDPGFMQIDHIDRDRGNNKISNLRIVTPSINNQNKSNQSALGVGVTKIKNCPCFIARIHLGGKRVYLGSYNSAEEASLAYSRAFEQSEEATGKLCLCMTSDG